MSEREAEVKATGYNLRDVQCQLGAASLPTWLRINIASADISRDIHQRYSENFYVEFTDLDGSVIKKELKSGRELLAFIAPLVERQVANAAEFQLRTEDERRKYLNIEMEAINKVIADAMNKRDTLRKEVSKLGKKAKGKR